MISAAGANPATCRHSSAPIDPPPPVTMIVFPDSPACIRAWSSSTLSLPNKSSIDTSRTMSAVTRPAIRSSSLGRVRKGVPTPSHIATSLFILLDDREGMAMMISSTACCFTRPGMSSKAPKTRTP